MASTKPQLQLIRVWIKGPDEKYKQNFLNRDAGFIIVTSDSVKHVFSEPIPYDSYPSDISHLKNKWDDLRIKIEEQWKTVCEENNLWFSNFNTKS